jgi:hypothetical protein
VQASAGPGWPAKEGVAARARKEAEWAVCGTGRPVEAHREAGDIALMPAGAPHWPNPTTSCRAQGYCGRSSCWPASWGPK